MAQMAPKMIARIHMRTLVLIQYSASLFAIVFAAVGEKISFTQELYDATRSPQTEAELYR